MAFGNPYGDAWSVGELIDALELLEAESLHVISLADTVGMATPQQIGDVVGGVLAKYDDLEIGVHLHSRPQRGRRESSCRLSAGCRRFDWRWEAWADVPLPRMRWSGIFPLKRSSKRFANGGGVAKPEAARYSSKATGGIAAKDSESQAAD